MGQYPDFAGGCHCLCGTQVCTLLCGLPKDVVSPWAKLLETVAIMATLYYVFQSAKRHAAALQQAS